MPHFESFSEEERKVVMARLDARGPEFKRALSRCDVYLERVWPDKRQVIAAVKDLIGGDRQASSIVDSAPCRMLKGIPQPEAQQAKSRLESLGAAVRVAPWPLLFPPGHFSDHSLQDAWYNQERSRVAAELEEPSLEEWGRATRVQEAYRFLFMSSRDSFAVRLYLDAGGMLRGSARSLDSRGDGTLAAGITRRSWSLSQDRWKSLQEALDAERFWSERWPSDSGLDGATWIFESWRPGTHHLQDIWSPKDGPAIDVARVFLAATPDSCWDLRKTIRSYAVTL